jgi:hypothetical protein
MPSFTVKDKDGTSFTFTQFTANVTWDGKGAPQFTVANPLRYTSITNGVRTHSDERGTYVINPAK